MRAPAPRRPRVLEVVRPHVRLESPAPTRSWSPERAAVIAHWSREATVSRSARALVAGLREAAYDVVVVSTAEVTGPLVWDGGAAPEGVVVLRRPNVGYDFGSWAVGLAQFPAVLYARRLILANDSLLGPFTSLSPLLERFETTPVDVWGLTDTTQFGRHLQSYFVGYTDGILADPVLRRFWADVRVEPTKDDVIHRNEIGLSQLLRREGYVADAAFPYTVAVTAGLNPTIRGWRALLDDGFPFVKRELVTDPSVAKDAHLVPLEIRRRFGQDVGEWL